MMMGWTPPRTASPAINSRRRIRHPRRRQLSWPVVLPHSVMLPVCASLPHQDDPVGSSGMSDVLPVRGLRESGSVVGLLHQPDPTVERLVANEGGAASPVKAVSRRRRGPEASLYRACWSAILVPPSLTAG